MTYYDVALLRQDLDFQLRCAACYSLETVDQPNADDPGAWATNHSWELASAPGFGEKYAYAIANNNPHPGRDTSVIPDADILAAVQHLMASEVPPP